MSDTNKLLQSIGRSGSTIQVIDDGIFLEQQDHLLDTPDISPLVEQDQREIAEEAEAVAAMLFADGIEREEDLPELMKDARQLVERGGFALDDKAERDPGSGEKLLQHTGLAIESNPELMSLDPVTQNRLQELGLDVRSDGMVGGFRSSPAPIRGLINDLSDPGEDHEPKR